MTGDVPIECFKALVDSACSALQEVSDLLITCFAEADVPNDWLQAQIVMLFRKGDTANCENYRTISLLAIVYKVFASLIKQRLHDAGLDARLSKKIRILDRMFECGFHMHSQDAN